MTKPQQKMNTDYTFNSKTWAADKVNLVNHFKTFGFVVVRAAYSELEASMIKMVINKNQLMQEQFRNTQKKFMSGKYPSFESIYVWNDTAGNDIFSKMTRSFKVIELLEMKFTFTIIK
jgi:uncharacterized protein YllA (UPF0747 family)